MEAMSEQKETNAEYHADLTHVSHSMLETFIKSPSEYHRQFVACTHTGERTKAMLFGSMVHCLVLEPKRLFVEFAVCDASTRNTKAYKAFVKSIAEEDACDGSNVRDIVLSHELTDARHCAEAIHTHPIAGPMLEDCTHYEESLRWTDPHTGMLCKCRVDAFGEIALDVKTARDPTPPQWDRDAVKFGYHRQADWYRAGLATNGYIHARFHFIVAGSTFPYEVAVRRAPQGWTERGLAENMEALRDLQARHAMDCWQADWQTQITDIGGKP